MKIQKITLANEKQVLQSGKTPENTIKPQVSNPINLNNYPSNVMNKSLVSFGGVAYYQTLEDNYFKLPSFAEPDVYQKKAAEKLFNGKDVLVTAPTGTGKTAIAHYIITKNLEEGKKTFYTTPLKALSNEKYRQFQKVYGEENVGILTGDVKINPQAPIVVMTTEVYRNMVFGDLFKENKTVSKDLKTVVFDELHYLGDVDRGGIWEQSIILSDKDTQLLSLSATIGNKENITNWMSLVKGKKTELVDVPSERRHVPLYFSHVRTEAKQDKKSGKRGKGTSSLGGRTPQISQKSYVQTVNRLSKKDQLPAIIFVFSKKESNKILNTFEDFGSQLNTKEEMKEISEIIKRYEKEGKYLGESLKKDALMKGYAIHNSGLLPTQKELVEELFQKKLVKVVLATETLSAGINMPARTVVITSTRKPTSAATADGMDGKRELTPNEFHQMAGRAGRRGIDTKGYVETLSVSTEQLKKFQELEAAKPNEIRSAFNPDFSFITHYYQSTDNDEVLKKILKKSLASYERKQENLFENFMDKKDLLKQYGYLQSGNRNTFKGDLLATINGYSQIPIIETISSGKLSTMMPIEFAASVAALANLDDKVEMKNPLGKKKDKIEEEFEHDNSTLKWFVDDLGKTLDKYNDKVDGLKDIPKVGVNKDIVKHIYQWADLNSKKEDSRENWKELYGGELRESIRDEGTLFKSITMTVDLLKQMRKVVDEAFAHKLDDKEKEYYNGIRENIEESLKLLQQEPVVYS